MRRTIWLASYPKSGNTWFRMLVANLCAGRNTPVDINNLPIRDGIASARGPFEYLLRIDSGLLTHDEIDCLRPRVYEMLAQGAADDEYDQQADAPSIRYVKVHDAYTLTSKGEPLLAGARGASGAIVIVRDPRDVASSLAHHNHTSIDDAVAQMNDANAQLCAQPDRQYPQLRQKLLHWSGHVASWLDQSDIPLHLIRYEELTADPHGVLRGALDFAGQSATDEDVERAVRAADFSQLQAQERECGFSELLKPHLGGTFFRRGESGAWREELTPAQAARIERAHKVMMQRLGYPLSAEGTERCEISL